MSHYSVLSASPLTCVDFAEFTFPPCSWRIQWELYSLSLYQSGRPESNNCTLSWAMKKPCFFVRVTLYHLRVLVHLGYSEDRLKNVNSFFVFFPSLAQWRRYCCISKLSQKFLPEACLFGILNICEWRWKMRVLQWTEVSCYFTSHLKLKLQKHLKAFASMQLHKWS